VEKRKFNKILSKEKVCKLNHRKLSSKEGEIVKEEESMMPKSWLLLKKIYLEQKKKADMNEKTI
jgi:hypothetical protein